MRIASYAKLMLEYILNEEHEAISNTTVTLPASQLYPY